ncbi:septation protein SepH [Corynebacterium urogenitale]
MQELKLVIAESDTASLVLRGVDANSEFFLPVTAELRDLLASAAGTDSPQAGETQTGNTQTGATVSALSSVVDLSASHASDPAESDAPASAPEDSSTGTNSRSGDESTGSAESGSDDHGTASAAILEGEVVGVEDSDNTTKSDVAASSDDQNAAASTQDAAQANSATSTRIAPVGASGVEKKRRHRIKINMSPRTIQDRVRHGASVAELAKEADTDEARIEPYAWPILQERGRIADLAHAAHPVLADEPTKQTLWEVLATALAARGATLSDATWDAYQDQSRRWLVSVEWEKEAAGQTSTHQAEFIFEQCAPGPDLVHANNSVASDLIDPRYGQPVRRMAAVTPLLGSGPAEEDDYSEYDNYDDEGDPTGNPAAREGHGSAGRSGLDALIGGGEQRNDRGQRGNQRPRGLYDRAGGAEDDTNEFLLHPDGEERKPAKRKRKAVTPHWEDVLLGVRTNPRKKK